MTRMVPWSTTAAPPVSAPIFTSVYCALSWSSSGTAGAPCATTGLGAIPTTIKATSRTAISIFCRIAIFLLWSCSHCQLGGFLWFSAKKAFAAVKTRLAPPRRPGKPHLYRPNTNPSSVRLLSLRFRLVSILFLLLQIVAYVRVWRRWWDFTSLSLGIWSGRYSVFPLLFGQRLKPGIHVYPQLIVHLLQVADVDSDAHADGTVILLAALDGSVHHVVIVRCVTGAGNHVAGSKPAFHAI